MQHGVAQPKAQLSQQAAGLVSKPKQESKDPPGGGYHLDVFAVSALMVTLKRRDESPQPIFASGMKLFVCVAMAYTSLDPKRYETAYHSCNVAILGEQTDF